MSLCSSIVEDLRIRIRNLTAAMVKEKGPEHAHVVQQEEPKTPGKALRSNASNVNLSSSPHQLGFVHIF
jgi:hypothetical protein